MIGNFKKNRYKRRLRKLRLMFFSLLKNTVVSTFVAGFIVASVPMFSAYEAHVINVTARIENDNLNIAPPTGYFCNDGNLAITLNTSLTDANIIYTLDGSDPDCFLPKPNGNGILYTAPFSLTYSATVKARVCHNDKQSAMVSEIYTVASEYCVLEKNCDALSIGYWQNHEGCKVDNPWSNWTLEINALSLAEFSGVFASISGEEICHYLAPKDCSSGGTVDGQFCRAKGKILANLSNVVSNHLDLDALISGADDGDEAFDNLKLSSITTIKEALSIIENIIANPNATKNDLINAAYVSERIYAFYEDENSNKPSCIYEEKKSTSYIAKPDLFSVPISNTFEDIMPAVTNSVFEGELPIKSSTESETDEMKKEKIKIESKEEVDKKKPGSKLMIDEISPEKSQNLKELTIEIPIVEEILTIKPLVIEETQKEFLPTESPIEEEFLSEESTQEELQNKENVEENSIELE